LNTKEANLQADLSALGTLKGALSAFQTSVQSLQGVSAFQANTATSSNTALFTASADGSAVAGSFSITVDQLAQPAKMRSGDFTSDTAVVGAGTLAISLGASSFNITTDSTTTLAGVRDAINQASDNPGITASIIKVDSGSQLLLTSNKLGAANAISIAATDTDALDGNDLNRLATANMTSIQTASDAIIHLDGQQVTRQSNSFSDVIPGITLSLNTANLSTPGTLSIAPDPTATTSKVQGFINAYNSLASTMSSLSNYNSTTQQASQLFGDATLRGVQNQIRQALSNPVQGVTGFSTLAEIGITTDSTGALVLDSTKFNSVMTSNPSGVSKLFASGNGLAMRFNNVLTNYLSSGGPLSSRMAGDNKQIAGITDQRDKLNLRLAALQARYLTQFNAMDALVGQLQATGNSLTQQLANLPGYTAKSSN
ncbi:MAG: flagellar filament capping protein FliD, partial [Methylobacter tundripaludum]|nr:flagellar filament capping protein FliD [Methylobacter tundripaludum]